jgi:diaminopropionate ammonia-lyase
MRAIAGAPHPEHIAGAPDAAPIAFHRGLPGYAPTPLVAAASLARELGIERLYVKDESSRFGLPAFKFLGASWAISRLLGGASDIASLAHGAREQGIERLTTATDGNHGRAVAHMATLVGLRATIYIPASMRAARRDAIAAEGAELVVVPEGYDAAVRRSLEDAAADGACRAVNDADLDGSTPVASWVIDGYSTMFGEIDAQLPADAAIDTVLLQTGVGAFAAAGVRWAARHGVVAIAVDPAGAPCIARSLAEGRPTVVETTGTAMAGLDAGTPSDPGRGAHRRDRDRRRRGGRGDARPRRARDRGGRVGCSGPRGAARARRGRALRHAAAAPGRPPRARGGHRGRDGSGALRARALGHNINLR